ncbi:protein YIPF5/7 [Emericellopsis cladophorae]|uniref:Protein YIP n=1 Tax=Emericellopsis cladophorae TaxID=2686198 RepID=A0A9Q0BDB6_9HYPO|nr:protein YIPF5/7 [Emericellopsis cladophorae]KAI6780651.1 protein YIPF5/7 [Emericellopsis cladophorae]
MANYYAQHPPQGGYAPQGAQNLQFYPSSYGAPGASPAPPGGPQSGGYGFVQSTTPSGFSNPAFGAGPGVSGRMGEQGGLRTGWLAAFSTEGYDQEPPLLEELGVNFGHIQAKTLAVLNPFRPINQHIMDDSDLAGPILFFLLFGTFLLFSGQVHFGYIYGLAVLGSCTLHIILSLMSPTDAQAAQEQPGPYQNHYADQQQGGGVSGGHFSATLTFPRSASVLGYCLLPLVATSLIGIVVPMNTPFGHVLTSAAILWCTYSASGMFCAVGRMRGMRALVAYPLALFYVGFGLMGIFSSRAVAIWNPFGSGSADSSQADMVH